MKTDICQPAEPQFVGDSSRRATTASRSQRVSGSSLPNLDQYAAAVNYAHKLHVRSVRKPRVALDDRAELQYLVLCHVIDKNDAVRVPDRGSAELKCSAKNNDILVQDFSWWTYDGNCLRVKVHSSHLDRYGFAVLMNLRTHGSTLRIDLKGFVRNEAVVPQVARKDSQSIAALLSFTPVRVEYPQPMSTRTNLPGSQQNAITTHSIIGGGRSSVSGHLLVCRPVRCPGRCSRYQARGISRISSLPAI